MENRKLEEKPEEICRGGLDKLNLKEKGENLWEIECICARLHKSMQVCMNLRKIERVF